jgi:CDP-L-myo-inositol myo-inositolphosphotransferase
MSDHIYEKAFIKKAVKGEGLIMDRVGRFIDPKETTKVKVEDGKIAAIGKQIKRWDGFDTGFFVLTPEIFEAAERVVGQKELVELSEIMQEARVKVTEVSGYLWMDVDTPQDLERAKRALLRNAVKGTGDGLVSRLLNRRISTYISTYVADLATPNQITIYTFLFGLFSAFVALFWPAGGGVFYQISSILDGVDGEIARASLQESRFGGWFDSLLDRFVDFAFFLALGRFLPLSSWPLIALTIFGMVMVSYSTERFKAAYQKDAYQAIPALRYLIGKRDERIFLTMLFCLWGKIKSLFIFMALLTNLRVLLTMYLVWRYEERLSNAF